MAQQPSGNGSSRSVLLWVTAGMATVLIALVVGAYLYFSPERLRRMVVVPIEGALQRKVELQHIGLSLWGGFSAEMNGLAIADRAGFGDRPFVSADRAEISLALLGILQGESGLGELTISRPTVSIVVNAEGEANYSDIGARTPVDDSHADDGSGTFILPVEWIRIVDASLQYLDHQEKTETTVDGLNVAMRLALAGAGLRVESTTRLHRVSVKSDSEPPTVLQDMRFDLDGTWSDPVLSTESIHIGLGPFAIQGSGKVSFQDETTHFDVHMDKQVVDLAQAWTYLIDNDMIEGGISLAGSLELSGRLRGPWKSRGIALPPHDLTLRIKDAVYTDPELLVPVREIRGDIEIKDGTVGIHALSARAGASDLSLEASATGLVGVPEDTRPEAEFALSGKLLDLDEILPPVATAAAAPTRSGTAQWGLTPSAWAAPTPPPDMTSPIPMLVRMVDGKGTLAFDRVKSEGVVYDNLSAKVATHGGVLSVKEVRADLYGGKLEAEVEIDARREKSNLPLRVTARVDSVQAQGLVSEMLGFSLPLHGRMGVGLEMSGAMDSSLTIVERAIKADGLAATAEARLVNWSILKLAAQQVGQLGFLNTDEVPIGSVKLPFHVQDGRVHIPETGITAAGLACRLSGSGGLDGTLDFALDLDLPASHLKDLGGQGLQSTLAALMGDRDVVVPLRIHVSGTTASPSIAAGVRPEARKAIQEKAKEKVKTRVKGLLRGLF